MSTLEAVLILLAGVGAGMINTIVGSGTLITFPTLIAFGYPPVVATMSNAIGLVPGGVSGTWGYRRELRGQWQRLPGRCPGRSSARSPAPGCCCTCRRTPSRRSCRCCWRSR